MISIVIAEDQSMLRGALGALLDLEEDIEVIGQASNGQEALDRVLALQPDLLLIDIEMPVKSGLQVAEELQKQKSLCKIVILTTFARPGYFERAAKAGVQGYLLKDGSSDELADSIRNVIKGKRVIAPELVFGVWKDENPLTAREQEILRLAAEGLTAQEISKRLFLSAGTVRNYISEAISKMNCKNRIEAISIAQDKGWI